MDTLPEKLETAIRNAGWIVDTKIGGGGGGNVFLCYKKALIDAVEKYRTVTGPTIRVTDQSDRSLRLLVREAYDSIVWKQDGVSVVKVPHSISDGDTLGRLRDEIKAMDSCDHPGLIKLINHDPKDPPQWFVMEYHANGILESHASKYKGKPVETLVAIKPVVDGVATLHRAGYVHRDIKPKNIFVTLKGDLVLGDFGIVFTRDDDRTRITKPGESICSRDWIPDWVRFRNPNEFTAKVDVFMLAKVIYFMITGENVLSTQLVDEDKDLAKLFSGAKGIALVNDLLKNCIVGREIDCKVENAEKLSKRIDGLIEQITRFPDKAAEILRWKNQIVTVIKDGTELGDGCTVEDCTPFWVQFNAIGSGRDYSEPLEGVRLAQDVTRNRRLKIILP